VIVLDTHVWIWWNTDDPQLSKRAIRALDEAESIYVSAISCFEIATAVRRRRLAFDREVARWITEALALPRVALVPLSVEIAVEAAQLSPLHGDPGDRIIAATALYLDVPLVTKDRRLRSYAGLVSVW
jgi:PIN domain nuclease of toxin-antitoxin system